jgi:transmembrane 9 superfamily protein 2/4
MFDDDDPSATHYERGFPLGFSATPPNSLEKKFYLFNHIKFIIYYHQDINVNALTSVSATGGDEWVEADAASAAPSIDPSNVEEANAAGATYRIVGFEIEPYTVKHQKQDSGKDWESSNLQSCTDSKLVSLEDEPQSLEGASSEVVFTYDVVWEPSEVKWANRWEMYLQSGGDDDIHWFSIVNSLMIVLFLTGMIAMILLRNLYRDITRYNEEALQTAEEAAEESGWKLVHGDVFRPPSGFFGPMFLSVFVGSGMQILAMVTSLLVLSVLGFISAGNSAGLITALVTLFVFCGIFAGYFAARLYKMFKGKAWKRNTFLTAFAFPGTIYGVALFLNFFVMYKRSSLAVPFPTYAALFAMWFMICVPLVSVHVIVYFQKFD